MSDVVTLNDFKGFTAIAISKKNLNVVQPFIDLFERDYLCDLLGQELAALYIADLDAQKEPQTQRFIDIHDPFCINDDCGNHKSDGLVQMLTQLLYYELLTNDEVSYATTGGVIASNENSIQSSSATLSKAQKRWNRGIRNYDAIQCFICDNIDTYPEYKGISKKVKHYGLI
jgi:hypothetical protein